jgi:hypothetical protein
MTAARGLLAEIIGEMDDWTPADDKIDVDIQFADAFLAALLSAPDPVRLELAALLNPWRPGPAPKDDDLPEDGVEVSTGGKWWRQVLPGAPEGDKI